MNCTLRTIRMDRQMDRLTDTRTDKAIDTIFAIRFLPRSKRTYGMYGKVVFERL